MDKSEFSLNIKNDLRLLSYLLTAIGLLMFFPAAIAFSRGEAIAVRAFFLGIAAIFVASLLLLLLTSGCKDRTVRTKDGYFFVTAAWVLTTFFGSIPLYASGYFPSFWSAFFETMSGFTTTGATILDSVEVLPSSLLFWRCETNWLGGMGIVILFVAIGPTLGKGGMKFFASESVGPTKSKITPKSRNNAIYLWLIYIALSAVQVVLLLLGGLDWYDSVTIAFSTISAAGFSTKNASIGAFGSNYVRMIVTVFMFIAGINFALYYKILTGRIKEALGDGELKSYILICLTSVALITICLTVSKVYPLPESLQQASFHFISLLTTTGYTAGDYRSWPQFAKTILFASMLCGGCAGSAGGGAKVIRFTTIVKTGVNNLKNVIHPNGVFPVRYGNTTLSEEIIHSIAGFCGLYFAIAGLGTIVLSLVPGVDFETALNISLLCLGNIGAGFGNVSCLSYLPDIIKVFLSFLMLIGRLELFTVLVLFKPDFWHN